VTWLKSALKNKTIQNIILYVVKINGFSVLPAGTISKILNILLLFTDGVNKYYYDLDHLRDGKE